MMSIDCQRTNSASETTNMDKLAIEALTFRTVVLFATVLPHENSIAFRFNFSHKQTPHDFDLQAVSNRIYIPNLLFYFLYTHGRNKTKFIFIN